FAASWNSHQTSFLVFSEPHHPTDGRNGAPFPAHGGFHVRGLRTDDTHGDALYLLLGGCTVSYHVRIVKRTRVRVVVHEAVRRGLGQGRRSDRQLLLGQLGPVREHIAA